MNNFRVLIYGMPGSGKTTYCAKRIINALSDGYLVFSNIEVSFEGHTAIGLSNSKFLKFLVRLIIKIIDYKILKLENKKVVEYYPSIPLTKLKLKIKQSIGFYSHLRYNLEKLVEVQIYDKDNYIFTMDFDFVVKTIKELPVERKKIVIWDEGFIDFSHQNSPSSSYAEFFNQGRHFNCDLVVSAQRAVAIFPTFRALCDYALECRKWWRFVEVRKHYLNSISSLPGGDNNSLYDFFKISSYSMFFNTYQRFI